MKKKKKKQNEKFNLIKICVISFAILIICAICFSISLTSGEKYSSSSSSSGEIDEDSILETATKEAGEVSDDERTKPTAISMDEYLEAYQNEENTVVLFSRDTCEYCKLATPILENIIYEGHVDLKYIDLATLSDEDKNTLATSDDYFSEGISTPLLVVVGNGSIVDTVEGLVTKEDYIAFFQEYGFME